MGGNSDGATGESNGASLLSRKLRRNEGAAGSQEHEKPRTVQNYLEGRPMIC